MQPFETVFHLDDQAFCGFFANPRQLHQRGDFFPLNGIDELLRRHAGEDRQRQLWPHTVGFNQLFKQRTFLFVVKTIQQLGIFTHHKVGKDYRLLTGLRQLIEAGHWHMHFIADARRFQQHQRGLFFENDASESAYHVGLLRYGLSIWRYHKKRLDRYPA